MASESPRRVASSRRDTGRNSTKRSATPRAPQSDTQVQGGKSPPLTGQASGTAHSQPPFESAPPKPISLTPPAPSREGRAQKTLLWIGSCIGTAMFWQHINEVTHSLLEVFKSVTPSTLFTFLGHLSLPLAIGIVAIAAYVLLEVYRRLKAYLAPVFAWLAPRLSPLRRFMPAISFGGKRHVALDLSHLKCGRIAFGRIIPENPDYHPARAKAQRCLAIDSKHICLILGVVAGDPDMVYVALVGSAPVDPHDELIVKGLLDPHFGPLTFNSVSAT